MEELNAIHKYENAVHKDDLEIKVEELHGESKELLSELNFMVDELKFFGNLLQSYEFVPHTKEMFEDSHFLLKDLDAVKKKNEEMKNLVNDHDNQLGGMMECDDTVCVLTYTGQHKKVKEQITNHILTFKDIKRRVFVFLNAILEKKKS